MNFKKKRKKHQYLIEVYLKFATKLLIIIKNWKEKKIFLGIKNLIRIVKVKIKKEKIIIVIRNHIEIK